MKFLFADLENEVHIFYALGPHRIRIYVQSYQSRDLSFHQERLRCIVTLWSYGDWKEVFDWTITVDSENLPNTPQEQFEKFFLSYVVQFLDGFPGEMP